ncbi:bifunctional enoyl-CoA hydratase/phosphate acetyltransferase [Ottowia caeni]|uniref:bifunctional enoyl-CoA hydratase/phosphate acetyltransferase n=1 Tax=Ottowia caeni TaxID=2870339 RepID=UPI001E576986|nr:bifunctional enoyl-CoA hydratase/phosphate acetyltransferase [Ottowia caeni]
MSNVNDFVENHTFEELEIGQSARLLRTLTLKDIQAFAAVSGDTNPAHLNEEYANGTMFQGVIGHGMWSGALISALLGTEFPGTGTIYLDQALHFSRPVRIGDTLTVSATVTSKDERKKIVELSCEAFNQKGERVVNGVARVLAPPHKIRMPRGSVPLIEVFDPEARFKNLLALVKNIPAVRCAVAHPCDEGTLSGVVVAASHGLLEPVLIGPEARIRAIAEEFSLDLNGMKIVNMPHSHAAADHAAGMAATGEVDSLMKGSLSADELIQAVLARKELQTGRRLSHVFRFDVPLYSKPLLLTDAAYNIRPSLEEKADIVQNAIDLARILGVELPRVALLSAGENVSSSMPSTLDAAALCKMADRGQIRDGLLDGPLAFDNAISAEAAMIRKIESPVAGQADILAVPDLESGSMLAKQLEYLAGAMGSGIVLGARVPIAFTSRTSGPRATASSAVLAQLVSHHRHTKELNPAI